jgi:hypothetical protein
MLLLDLPSEILQIVVDKVSFLGGEPSGLNSFLRLVQLHHRKDLKNLCEVSKLFHGLASPKLYKSLPIRVEVDKFREVPGYNPFSKFDSGYCYQLISQYTTDVNIGISPSWGDWNFGPRCGKHLQPWEHPHFQEVGHLFGTQVEWGHELETSTLSFLE